MDIGSKIRELRIKRNLTQEELGQKLNVTPQAVSRWENGISLPDISMIPLMSEKLFVSADELLGCISYGYNLFESCKKLNIFGDNLKQDQIDSMFEGREKVTDKTPKKVLIVDDSDFMRMMLKDMLSQSGHRIVEADNGKAALKVLEKETPDVCVLDINMPEMNGLDVLRHIVSNYRNTRVIMLSALCMESIVKEALEIGANAFVAKPFQADSIIRRV